MHVAIFNTLYPPIVKGGAERSVHTLVGLLEQRGVRVTVVTCAADGHGDTAGVIRLPLPDANPWSSRPMAGHEKVAWHATEAATRPSHDRQIRDILRGIKPDLVHTHNLAGIGLGVWRQAARLEIPVVHTLRDYYLLCLRSTLFRAGGGQCLSRCGSCRVATIPRRYLSTKNVRAVVGISDHVLRRHLSAGYFSAAAHTRVIPNPLPPPAWRVPSDAHIRSRDILFLGQLTPEKGVHVLVKAFREMSHRGIRLLIAGEGRSDYLQDLRSLASGDPRIHFLGKVDPAVVLPMVPIVAVPSLWEEPFGRVVAEAAAHGCYVLYSESGGLPEAANLSGAWGQAVSANSPEEWGTSLAEAISRVEDETTRPVASSDSEASSHSVVEKHLELYSEILLSSA